MLATRNYLTLILMLDAVAATAQNYPARPIRMIIPFTAGSAADIIARAMDPALRERLGQPLVIDNRGGAGGNIAAEMTAKSTPDGYTLMMATIGTHAINLALYPKLPYHPQRDFTPVALVGESPNVLVIHPSVPAQSIRDLIALAKARPSQLNYGSSGAGTSVHLSAELFSSMTGVRMVHVPFKGATEALTALLGGQLDLMFASLSSSIPLIKAGRLRAFAVTGAKRSAAMPDVPTVIEAGVPDYEVVAWYGMFAPHGTPRAVITRVSAETARILNLPDVRERLSAEGAEVSANTPEQFTAYVKSEMAKWSWVVQKSGARAE